MIKEFLGNEQSVQSIYLQTHQDIKTWILAQGQTCERFWMGGRKQI